MFKPIALLCRQLNFHFVGSGGKFYSFFVGMVLFSSSLTMLSFITCFTVGFVKTDVKRTSKQDSANHGTASGAQESPGAFRKSPRDAEAPALGLRVQGLGFRVQGLVFWRATGAPRIGLQTWWLRFSVPDFERFESTLGFGV